MDVEKERKRNSGPRRDYIIPDFAGHAGDKGTIVCLQRRRFLQTLYWRGINIALEMASV
jgi:hypothetical protein